MPKNPLEKRLPLNSLPFAVLDKVLSFTGEATSDAQRVIHGDKHVYGQIRTYLRLIKRHQQTISTSDPAFADLPASIRGYLDMARTMPPNRFHRKLDQLYAQAKATLDAWLGLVNGLYWVNRCCDAASHSYDARQLRRWFSGRVYELWQGVKASVPTTNLSSTAADAVDLRWRWPVGGFDGFFPATNMSHALLRQLTPENRQAMVQAGLHLQDIQSLSHQQTQCLFAWLEKSEVAQQNPRLAFDIIRAISFDVHRTTFRNASPPIFTWFFQYPLSEAFIIEKAEGRLKEISHLSSQRQQFVLANRPIIDTDMLLASFPQLHEQVTQFDYMERSLLTGVTGGGAAPLAAIEKLLFLVVHTVWVQLHDIYCQLFLSTSYQPPVYPTHYRSLSTSAKKALAELLISPEFSSEVDFELLERIVFAVDRDLYQCALTQSTARHFFGGLAHGTHLRFFVFAVNCFDDLASSDFIKHKVAAIYHLLKDQSKEDQRAYLASEPSDEHQRVLVDNSIPPVSMDNIMANWEFLDFVMLLMRVDAYTMFPPITLLVQIICLPLSLMGYGLHRLGAYPSAVDKIGLPEEDQLRATSEAVPALTV